LITFLSASYYFHHKNPLFISRSLSQHLIDLLFIPNSPSQHLNDPLFISNSPSQHLNEPLSFSNSPSQYLNDPLLIPNSPSQHLNTPYIHTISPSQHLKNNLITTPHSHSTFFWRRLTFCDSSQENLSPLHVISTSPNFFSFPHFTSQTISTSLYLLLRTTESCITYFFHPYSVFSYFRADLFPYSEAVLILFRRLSGVHF